jgi:inner membrane protein
MARMDNLSHAVAGLVAGELIHRCLPAEADAESQSRRHRLLLTGCALASNFPDLDLVTTGLLPAPLGYLLNHRGHTHTLLYAIPQALLLWAALWLLWPSARRLLGASRTTRAGLVAAIATGFILHLCMDFLNSYGLHPFHPFDSRWLYGDMVFILEPVFWIGFGVPMAMMVRSAPLRFLLLAALVGAPLYFTIAGFLAWMSMAALATLALALALLQRASGARGFAGLVGAVAAASLFVVMQAAASDAARQAVMAAARAADPQAEFIDASMSSFPSNPVCWSFVSVEKNEAAGSYRLQRGIVSLLPDAMPVSACPVELIEDTRSRNPATGIVILSQRQGDLAALRGLDRENCHFAAWMRFARMPSVDETSASDLRFANRLRENFSTMRFEDFRDRACAGNVPQWDKPRQDLLTPP